MSRQIQPEYKDNHNSYLLYDVSYSDQLTNDWFNIEYWRDRATVASTGLGRGSAWFISTSETDYVLRHYRRGGLVSKVISDRYLWTGLENTRAWREWKLLAHLYEIDLPAPIPVAARVYRRGLFYTADLITLKLPSTISLSESLRQNELPQETWQAIGQTICHFHQHQIFHADLNAHNILLDENNKVSLIDFDKGQIKTGSHWHEANLQRLHRSLTKLAEQWDSFHYCDGDWQQLLNGYQQASR